MMRTIAMDACTTILLAKASVLETCLETYNVHMTTSVLKEVLKGKQNLFQDALLVERLHSESKIKIVNSDGKITQKLMNDFNMGRGEASIIAVGLKGGLIIATDNRQGRKAAVISNLPLVGSIEIIVNLFGKKKINKEKTKTALKVLKQEGWFDPNLIEKSMEDIK